MSQENQIRQENYTISRIDPKSINDVLRRLQVRLDSIQKELDNLKRTKVDK